MTSSKPFTNLSASKRADGERGAIATSSPYASEAGRDILAAGGNAADAAVAACLALAVADPANTGLAGRCHFLLADESGVVHAIDGASMQPDGVPPLKPAEVLRTGHAAVPVPGNLAALDRVSREFGRLSFVDVAAPALTLARRGFRVPERLAAAWQRHGAQLAMDPPAQVAISSIGKACRRHRGRYFASQPWPNCWHS